MDSHNCKAKPRVTHMPVKRIVCTQGVTPHEPAAVESKAASKNKKKGKNAGQPFALNEARTIFVMMLAVHGVLKAFLTPS